MENKIKFCVECAHCVPFTNGGRLDLSQCKCPETLKVDREFLVDGKVDSERRMPFCTHNRENGYGKCGVVAKFWIPIPPKPPKPAPWYKRLFKRKTP